MKLGKIIHNFLIFGLMLGGFSQWSFAQEVPALVESQGIKCDKVVLSRDGDSLVAKYLVQQAPVYNNYSGVVGERVLSSANTDLRQVANQLASWLIVVDISDPHGRKQTILNSAAVATRLVTLMSPESNVRILAMAGSQQVVMASDSDEASPLKAIMNEGTDSEPIFVRGRKGQPVFDNQLYHLIVNSVINANVQSSNTNLWIGLARALKEQMPDCSKGMYQYLPKGVILISDGADESRSSESDFQDLVKTAREAGVPIHTIGFPFKDSSRNETERFKGYAALQRLAVQTDASFISSDAVEDVNSPVAAANLLQLLRKTSAAVMQLKTDIREIPAAHSLKLELMDGQKHQSYLEVRQEQLGLVIADHALETLYALKDKYADKKLTDTDRSQLAQVVGSFFMSRLMPLTATEHIFDGTSVDRDYARRVKTLLLHIHSTEGLSKKNGLINDVATYLLNSEAQLPEPLKESQNIVVNTHNTNEVKNSSSSAYSDEEETSGLVWWVLGIGGASACLIVFILIIRSMNKEDVATSGDMHGSNGHSRPLAYLEDSNQLGRNWPVVKTSVTVGRNNAADISLPSAHISAIHFTLYCDASGKWMIKDANSTNGTKVNGRLISSATPINSGDSIDLADMRLTFRV